MLLNILAIFVFPLVVGYIYGGNGYEPPLYAEMGAK
jgi:hypothetical protein